MVKKLINQLKGNVMQNDKIYAVASDLYFYFIDLHGLREACVIENDDYSENTDLGRELYYQIEDELVKNTQPTKN